MGNLNFNTTPEQLSEFLEPAGEIVDVYFAMDRDTGRPRGFAFVTFAEESQAAEAIEMFNGSELDGRSLNINEAKDRPRRQGGPQFAGPRFNGPKENRPRFEESSPKAAGGNRSGGAFTAGEFEDYDPHVEKGADDRNYDTEYEDGGGRNRGRRGKKSKKGSRRGLRARKRSI